MERVSSSRTSHSIWRSIWVVPITRRAAVSEFRLGGTALGLVNAFSNVGNVLGAALAGYLYDIAGAVIIYGLTLPIFIMALPLIASLASAFLAMKGKSHYN